VQGRPIRSFLKGMTSVPSHNDITHPRVIIVGSGLAGLTATITAASLSTPDSPVEVVLLEKGSKLGGNSAKATSGISAVNRKEGDSPQLFISDTKKAGHNANDQELLNTLAVNSESALEFLQKSLSRDKEVGDPTSRLTKTIRGGGHSVSRTFRFQETNGGMPIPLGYTLISTLKRHAESLENVHILSEAKVLDLVKQGPRISGVRVATAGSDLEGKKKDLFGDAVILSTGGFGASEKALRKYAPSVAELSTTNGDFATGDGLDIAGRAGAGLRDMKYVQIHPTGFLHPDRLTERSVFLAPEALRACGAILVSPTNGKRFSNELLPRDKLSELIFRNGILVDDWIKTKQKKTSTCKRVTQDTSQKKKVVVAMIASDDTVKEFGQASAKFYEKMGVMKRYESVRELAKGMNIEYTTLSTELDTYANTKDGKGDPYEKILFPHKESYSSKSSKGFWLAWITPSIHYCMGGLRYNTHAQILDSDGKILPGLFAAGELTGGLHGHNRIVGNSLLDCVVFGRIAGEEAVKYTKSVKNIELKEHC